MLVRKNNIVYYKHKDQWGWKLLKFINFEEMTIRKRNNETVKLYVNDYDIVCLNDKPLSETIQQHYDEWIDEVVDFTLLGEYE